MTRFSRGRAVIALSAALASLTFAASAHADLVQSPPTNVTGGFFDDHSIGGDNHLGWGYTGTQGTSDVEPMAVTFGSSLTNASASAFRVCGYPSGTSGWMRAFEVPGACPGAAPASGQDGWFRYVTANHSDEAPATFNRWHLMDLQRFALVPVPGSTGHAVAWDVGWGTCLANNAPDMQCVQALGAASLNTSIGAAATKLTQEPAPAPDATRIAIPAAAGGQFPDGAYQVVAISNPYGLYSGPSNVACTGITLSGATGYAPVVSNATTPSTCYVPASLQAPLTGPTGRDPLANEAATNPACTLLPASGHCWATVPMSGDNTLARTNATAANVVDSGGAVVAVPQGGSLTQGSPVTAAGTAPVTPATVGASTSATARTITARLSRTYSRRAARAVFGRRLSRLKVSCRVSSSSTSRCTVSFRKSGARYSGRIFLRYRTVSGRLRWQYRVEVRKRKSGRTQTIRRAYRTGGTLG